MANSNGSSQLSLLSGGVMYHSRNWSTVAMRRAFGWSPIVSSGEKNARCLDGSYTKSLYLLALRFVTAKKLVSLLCSGIKVDCLKVICRT